MFYDYIIIIVTVIVCFHFYNIYSIRDFHSLGYFRYADIFKILNHFTVSQKKHGEWFDSWLCSIRIFVWQTATFLENYWMTLSANLGAFTMPRGNVLELLMITHKPMWRIPDSWWFTWCFLAQVSRNFTTISNMKSGILTRWTPSEFNWLSHHNKMGGNSVTSFGTSYWYHCHGKNFNSKLMSGLWPRWILHESYEFGIADFLHGDMSKLRWFGCMVAG